MFLNIHEATLEAKKPTKLYQHNCFKSGVWWAVGCICNVCKKQVNNQQRFPPITQKEENHCGYRGEIQVILVHSARYEVTYHVVLFHQPLLKNILLGHGDSLDTNMNPERSRYVSTLKSPFQFWVYDPKASK